MVKYLAEAYNTLVNNLPRKNDPKKKNSAVVKVLNNCLHDQKQQMSYESFDASFICGSSQPSTHFDLGSAVIEQDFQQMMTTEHPQTVFDISCLTSTQVGNLIDKAYIVMSPPIEPHQLPTISSLRPLPLLKQTKQIFKTHKLTKVEQRHHKKQSLLRVIDRAI